MRQRRWLELLKDYDCTILYHPGKANVVTDALSRKSMGSLSHVSVHQRPLVKEIRECFNNGVMLSISETGEMVAHLRVRSSLVDEVKQLQHGDDFCKEKIAQIRQGLCEEFRVHDDSILWFQDCLVVPKAGDIRRRLLEAAHSSSYAIHPGSTKMYHDLRMHYWWKGMKRDVVDFVVKCLTCQHVKAEHQKLAGTLQV